MSSLADIIYERFAMEILTWEPPLKEEIYALSFYVDLDESDANHFEVLLSYNTRQQVQSEVAQAGSEGAARWDFGYWQQDFKACVATHDADFGSADLVPLVDAWLRAEGLFRTEADLKALLDLELYEDWQEHNHAFESKVTEAATEAARRLHDTGIILAAFGRHIPIILHQDDFYPPLLEETLEANPEGQAAEYEAWCDENETEEE